MFAPFLPFDMQGVALMGELESSISTYSEHVIDQPEYDIEEKTEQSKSVDDFEIHQERATGSSVGCTAPSAANGW